jgi:hypothetical protein
MFEEAVDWFSGNHSAAFRCNRYEGAVWGSRSAKRTHGLREASAELPAFALSDNPVVSQFEFQQWLEKPSLGQTA